MPRKAEGERPDHAALLQRIVEFVVKSRTDGPIPELLAQYHALVQLLGFSHVALMDISQAEPNPNSGLRLNTFPDELVAQVSRTPVDFSDPVWKAAVVSDRAFLWSDVVRRAGRDAADPSLLYRAVGLEDGLTIPLHARDVWRTVVFLGAARTPDVDDTIEAMLIVASWAMAARAPGRHVPLGVGRRLTEREKQVLTFTAYGKSAWEIGIILDMSEKTVARHLLNIRGKLAAVNTVQAVVIALRQNQIQL